MKKLILGMVFVFATGTMMNASTSIEELDINFKNSEVEVEGPGRECVNWASSVTISHANQPDNTGDPNDYLWLYHNAYNFCMSQFGIE
jgi:hypothetical protein